MFDKKTKKESTSQPDNSASSLQIETIPADFYGGKDPDIYELKTPSKNKQTSTADVSLQPKPLAQPPLVAPKVPVSAVKKVAPEKVGQRVTTGKQKKGNMMVMIVFIAIIILAGVSWYVIADTLKQTTPSSINTEDTTSPPPVSKDPNVAESPVVSTNPVIIPSTTSDIDSDSLLSAFVPIDFPRTIFSTAVDLDMDELTDVEEEVFGTDSGTWDSDEDGYYDGQEVANLYNPRGFAPKRIIDSGLVREYINPVLQYRVYYPVEWEVAAVDTEATQVLFSAITGDYIEVRSIEKPAAQSFSAWFARYATGQRFSDLTAEENRFEMDGYVRRDGLVAYVQSDTHVFVILYHPGTSQRIAYPHIMNMVFQSFRPSRMSPTLPEQVVIPTSSPVMATSTIDMTTSTDTLLPVVSTSLRDAATTTQ